MSGKASRDKGKRGELEICRMIRDELGVVVNRQLKQYQEPQHGDIEQLIGGLLIEVKNCKDADKINSWWKQAVDAAKHRRAIPCLAYKVPRRGWRFVVPTPEALACDQEWCSGLEYTNTMFQAGFLLFVQERLNGQ